MIKVHCDTCGQLINDEPGRYSYWTVRGMEGRAERHYCGASCINRARLEIMEKQAEERKAAKLLA